MKVSYNWLKDYLTLDMPAVALGDIMTDIGLEVEGIETVESVKGGLKGVIVAEVVSCQPHPNADKLKITRVNTGQETLPVVCGAPNVRQGLKVLLATIGTTLYDGDDKPWKIKKGKIRGEESHGMICAEDELGLGQSHAGIMELSPDAPVGRSAAEYLSIRTDEVFDVGLTPNRSDATGHLGVARDLKAYFAFHGPGQQLRLPPRTSKLNCEGTPRNMSVEVRDIKACPRYSGIVLDVSVGPSPKWIQDRLKAIGVRPINNVIDITNYVLHEYGQPLHAFDYDKIGDQKIIVTKLAEGTSFVSLDEKERKLSGDDLMICDGSLSPMCMGGVFGGRDSGVSEKTKTIFLESAHFEAIGIRKSSTRHLLFTDAARCFEKGSDPNIAVEAIQRAVFLLEQYAQAKVAGDLVDIYPEVIAPRAIEVSLSYINGLLGYTFTHQDLTRLFDALEMPFTENEGKYKVQIPTNKTDVTRPADVAEEVLRIFGMNNIPTQERLNYSFNHQQFGVGYQQRERAGNLLSSQGWHEAMGLSLTNEKYFAGNADLVKINNTSNIHLNVMRPDLLASMLESVSYNLNRQQDSIKLFEFGRTYRRLGEKFEEKEVLGIVLSGLWQRESWRANTPIMGDFFQVRAAVSNVLSLFYLEEGQLREVEDEVLSPAFVMERGPMEIYRVGEVNDVWREKMGVKLPVFAAVIDWKNLLKVGKDTMTVRPVSKFPSSRRDLALIMDTSVTYQAVYEIVKKTGKDLLDEVDLFDIYTREDHLGKDKKSYAIKMIFSHPDRTLRDGEVEAILQAITHRLKAELGVTLRG